MSGNTEAKRLLRRRVSVIIQYEPSWFAEFSSAAGILLWSVFTFMTDDFDIQGTSWIMPIIGLMVGPSRAALLLNLDARPRVLAAMFGFIWWSCLASALEIKMGIVPGMSGFLAVAIGDVLTVGKFSLGYLKQPTTGSHA